MRCDALSFAAYTSALVLLCAALAAAAIPRRGLYVSLDTTYASAATTVYDDLLAHPARQDALLSYCRLRGFDAVSVYDLQRVLRGQGGGPYT